MKHPCAGLGVHRRALLLSSLVIALTMLAGASSVAAAPWNEPEQVTFNSVEDRTTSGSLVYPCYGEAYAIWMQAQGAPGWRIMFAERNIHGWSEPLPVDPGSHADYDPRLGSSATGLVAVWQRGTSTAAEIVFAERTGDVWSVVPITTNATEDLSPDLAAITTGTHHVAWAGLDPVSQSGKIFHAENSGTGWQVEVLTGSELGPFWTGAEPHIDVSANGDVHIVYRGGDYGNYHLHYARRVGTTWTYQVLFSGNGNDLATDVSSLWTNQVVVAMSGNDGFGFPSRIYIRRSTDGGASFGAPELVSGSYSASLENLTGGVPGLAVSGSEVSGNIYTGNLFYWLEGAGPELLPPLDMASERPSAGQITCIPLTESAGDESVLYVHYGGGGSSDAEVTFLATPGPNIGLADPDSAPLPLRLAVAPNPFSTSTRIEIETLDALGPGAVGAAIYDIAGHLVRRLDENAASARHPAFVWDGMTANGARAAAGLYLLVVEGSGLRASERLVRLK